MAEIVYTCISNYGFRSAIVLQGRAKLMGSDCHSFMPGVDKLLQFKFVLWHGILQTLFDSQFSVSVTASCRYVKVHATTLVGVTR